ncbi:hypothetical protein JST97_23325 [bacterium]|nr:hypothetical protein [bacterium]
MPQIPAFDGGPAHLAYINDRFRKEELDDALDEKVVETLSNRRAFLEELANNWLNNSEVSFEKETVAALNLMKLIFLANRGQDSPKPHKVFQGFIKHPNPQVARAAFAYQLASEPNEVKDLRNLSRAMEYQKTGRLPPHFFSIERE